MSPAKNVKSSQSVLPGGSRPNSADVATLLLQFVALLFFTTCIPSVVCGQVTDSFESGETFWRIEQWDGLRDASQIVHGASKRQQHSGQQSYRFHFTAGSGKQIMASQGIAPSMLIPELAPSLHVYTSRPGVQIFARVVLPNTMSATGNGPLRVLVAGQVCENRHRWTRLDFSGPNGETLHQRFRAQLSVLRQKHGADLNEKAAFVDAVVLNLYTGAGEHEVFVDSLVVEGHIAPPSTTDFGLPDDRQQMAQQRVISHQQDEVLRPSRVSTDNTQLRVDERPFVIRALEYNGEPLGLVQDLGFNTLWLRDPPSLDQLRRAREHSLWIIAPLSSDQGPVLIDWQYDVVLAWLVGQDVQWMDYGAVRQRIEAIRAVDTRRGRPVLVQARSGLADYARAADILCVGKPVVGTTFPLIQYGTWLRQRRDLAQAYIPVLAEIQTELPQSVVQQSALFSSVNPPLAMQSSQMRGMAWQAVAGGARGFVFRSRTRLDAESATNTQRRLHLSLLNRQLQQITPWIAGAAAVEPLVQVDPNVQVAVLKTSGSRLLLVQQSTGRESYSAGLASQGMLTIRDPAAGVADQPYRLTPTGLVPANHQRLGNQLAVQLPNASDWELIVLTQDPVVIRYVEQISQAERTWTSNQLQIEHAFLTAEWANRVFSAMLQAGREPENARVSVARISELSTGMEALVASADPLAVWSQGIQLQREVGQFYDSLVREAQGMMPWPTGSPLTLHPILIPLHWQSLNRMADTPWSPNALPGGDFEDLEHAVRSGWQHQSAPGMSIRTLVQLHHEAMADGRRGLLMAAEPDGGLAPQIVESAPVWIVSAPVEVPANHLVRINGYVRIDTPVRGSLDGLVIQESLGGPDMAQRVPATNGWQQFTIYRATSEPQTLRLNFALTGYGKVYVDEVTVQLAPLPGSEMIPDGVAREATSVVAGNDPVPLK